MLQSIHQRAQGWIAWVIIGLVCLTFALWGIHNYLGPDTGDKAIVSVNDAPITQTQLSAATERMTRLKKLQDPQLSLTAAETEQLQQVALQELIKMDALSQAAQDAGLRIGDNQLNQAISKTPFFMENGHFSEAKFNLFLSNMSYTPSEFFTVMRKGLLNEQFRMGVVNSDFATPSEIKTNLDLLHETRSFDYILIAADAYKKEVTVTPKQITAYYQANRQYFQTPAQVKLDYIELAIGDIKKTIDISAAQIQQYYQEHLSDYTTPAQFQVAHILIKYPDSNTPADRKKAEDLAKEVAKKAEAGEEFSQLAATYSQDILTAKKGGLLPWMRVQESDPSFAKAAESLTKPGQTIGPVATKYGYEILQLKANKPAVVKPLSAVEDTIKSSLQQQQAEQQFANLSEQLANVSFEQPDALEPAAKATGLPIHHTTYFSQTGGDTAFTREPRVIEAAFSASVQQGNNSDPITLGPEKIVVLRVADKKPQQQQSLKTVEPTIRTFLTQKAASEKAKVVAETLSNELANTTPSAAKMAVTKAGFQWTAQPDAERQQATPDPLIIKAVFEMPKPREGKAEHQLVFLPNSDVALIQLRTVNTNESASANSEKINAFRQDLALAKGLSTYAEYVKAVLTLSDIVYKDPELAKQQSTSADS